MFHFISFRLQFSLVHRLAHGSVLCGDNCIIIFRSLSNVMTQKPIDANVSWQNTMRRPRTEPTGNSHVVSIGFLFGEIIIIIGVYISIVFGAGPVTPRLIVILLSATCTYRHYIQRCANRQPAKIRRALSNEPNVCLTLSDGKKEEETKNRTDFWHFDVEHAMWPGINCLRV